MDVDDYQTWAGTKANKNAPLDRRLNMAVLGIGGESGEVLDVYKKFLEGKTELDPEKLVLELGDLMWYAAELANVLGISLSHVLWVNREKLDRLYPAGYVPKFGGENGAT
jgi:NTP pyrophosphatase (non-canonical NTP hydrolase)